MIELYWKNATDRVVGAEHGVTAAELAEAGPLVEAAHARLMEQVRRGQPGYTALPDHPSYPAQVKQVADRFRDNTTDVVVLGIGGSALGAIAIQTALHPATYNLMTDKKRGGPRLFVLDNVDPVLVGDTLKFLGRRLETTLFNVISKSGETAETAAQFMIVRQMLKDRLGETFASRIVATTDAEKGTLHEIAKQEGYATLPVPGDVGGRFSVLSPVGLFPAAMTGIDIEAMLAGALAMKQRLANPRWRENPACVLALVKHLMFTKKGKPLHVMMPYSNRLYMLADWYRQLWAESLGKQHARDGREVFTGPTPIKALGTTDQHSQVQLYREGPNDKLVTFLEVEKHPSDIRIPEGFADTPGMGYLAKARMSKLLAAEKSATEYALAVSKRPSLTLRFNGITAPSVGEFFYLYEFVTSIAGDLLGIDPYDQPAVELGKKATFALMGRPGYEDTAKEMKSLLREDKNYLA